MWRLLLIAALVSGCTQVSQPLVPGKVYKRDVKIIHEGTQYTGVGVLPGGKAKYVLELTFAGELDLFTFRNCHREVTQEDAGGGRIFGKRNKVAFEYIPVSPIETDEPCTVDIGGYEREGGRHSWGFLDFKTPRENLDAVVLCNGRRDRFKGVSVCQSPAGLLQQVTFATDVVAKTTSDCPEPLSDDSRTFDIYPALGRCVYSFRQKFGEKREFHRYSTLGYQDILIRKAG